MAAWCARQTTAGEVEWWNGHQEMGNAVKDGNELDEVTKLRSLQELNGKSSHKAASEF